MFTKLKQKLAEEEHSDLGSSLPSSPSSSRKSRVASQENKWQRQRLSSVSTYYGSRESVFTEPGLISRNPSFNATVCNGAVNGSGRFCEMVSAVQRTALTVSVCNNALIFN